MAFAFGGAPRSQQRQQSHRGSRIQCSCGLLLGWRTVTSLDLGVWVEQVARWVSEEVRLEGGRAVAVLVDGPDDVLGKLPQERSGGALLHRRQLQRVYGEGYVVGVSVVGWEALGGDVGRQEALLRTLLLQGAGGQQGGGGSGYVEGRSLCSGGVSCPCFLTGGGGIRCTSSCARRCTGPSGTSQVGLALIGVVTLLARNKAISAELGRAGAPGARVHTCCKVCKARCTLASVLLGPLCC